MNYDAPGAEFDYLLRVFFCTCPNMMNYQGEGIGVRKNKKTFVNSAMPVACGVGLTLALMVVTLLILFSAICINNEYFSVEASKYLAVGIEFAGVFAGTLLAGKLSSDRKLLSCIVVSSAHIVLQVCGTLLFFDGISSSIITQLVATIAGAISGFFLAVKSRNNYGSKKKRRKHR